MNPDYLYNKSINDIRNLFRVVGITSDGVNLYLADGLTVPKQATCHLGPNVYIINQISELTPLRISMIDRHQFADNICKLKDNLSRTPVHVIAISVRPEHKHCLSQVIDIIDNLDLNIQTAAGTSILLDENESKLWHETFWFKRYTSKLCECIPDHSTRELIADAVVIAARMAGQTRDTFSTIFPHLNKKFVDDIIRNGVPENVVLWRGEK